jgi:flagellar basal-body rod modification protein FlgD
MTYMSTKFTTKAFGEVQGSSSKEDGPKNLSAQDLKKIGEEDIGAVLNKVADPNWVDPTKKVRTTGDNSMDRDAFFKLMLTQMKNQDPTNPLKSHEMAAQLASFTSLEQMQNMNTTLTDIKNGQKPTENYQALNLIGKAVEGDSSKIVRAANDKIHDLEFNLGKDASKVVVRIRNAQGEVVRKIDMNDLKQGQNRVSWNGQSENGMSLPAGDYQFFAEGEEASGAKIAINTEFSGQITGINYSQQGPVLLIGNQTIRMRDVKKIVDPSLMRNDQKLNEISTQDLNPKVSAGDTETSKPVQVKPEANRQDPDLPLSSQVKTNIFESVGLSREMMDKVNKEIK